MENFFDSFAGPEIFENGLHRDPLPPDRRLTVANIFVDRNSVDKRVHKNKVTNLR